MEKLNETRKDMTARQEEIYEYISPWSCPDAVFSEQIIAENFTSAGLVKAF